METVTNIGLVLCSVAAILLVVSGMAKLTLNLIRRPLEARVAAVYQPEEVLMQDFTANSFGVESRGMMQIRGNGALVLTNDRLHFFRFFQRGDLCVPLDSITDVTFTRSHLGKATMHRLLKIRFATEQSSDSIALYVNNPDSWKSTIEEISPPAPREGSAQPGEGQLT